MLCHGTRHIGNAMEPVVLCHGTRHIVNAMEPVSYYSIGTVHYALESSFHALELSGDIK